MIGNLHSKKAQRFTMRWGQHGERGQKIQSICAIKMRPTLNKDGFTQTQWLTFIRCHYEKHNIRRFDLSRGGTRPLCGVDGLF